MLALSPAQRILLAVNPVDFRKGIDGLIGLCRQRLGENPMSGTLFVFTNRRRTALKLLIFDGVGIYLILKRFSQGRLRWWPDGSQPCHEMASRELAVLLWNGHLPQASWAPLWRPLSSVPTAEPGNSTVTKALGFDATQTGAAAELSGRRTDSLRPGLPF